MSSTTPDKDKTPGQPRRSTDSRPRPGAGVPEAEADALNRTNGGAVASKGDRKPSESWSPIDPGRPKKND